MTSMIPVFPHPDESQDPDGPVRAVQSAAPGNLLFLHGRVWQLGPDFRQDEAVREARSAGGRSSTCATTILSSPSSQPP
jgi:hypothetical protein